jgi:hypothetical protein
MLEALSGVRTEATDPALDILIPQQPEGATLAFQLQRVREMASQVRG